MLSHIDIDPLQQRAISVWVPAHPSCGRGAGRAGAARPLQVCRNRWWL